MRPSVLRWILVCMLLAFLGGVTGFYFAWTKAGRMTPYSSVTPMAQAEESVITLLHYFESGRRSVGSYLTGRLERGEKDLGPVLDRCIEACVRVDIHFNRKGGHYQTVIGSGVIIDEGRYLLTAGHSLQGQTDYSVEVTLRDGTSFRARPTDWQYEVYGGANQDWALMAINHPSPGDLPAVEVGTIDENDVAIILGYPDRIGINSDGHVAHGFGFQGAYLEPLTFVGQVDRVSPLEMIPIAGSVPLGGMSGGPVFNEEGRLVGVFVSVGKKAGTQGIRYTLNASTVSALEGAMRK